MKLPKLRHPWALFLSILLASFLLILPQLPYPQFLRCSFSSSVPKGCYWQESEGEPRLGDIIGFRMPTAVTAYFTEVGGQAPEAILKPVAASAGVMACYREGRVYLDDTPLNPAVESDAAGISLPKWQGCRVLRDDEFWVYSTFAPSSVDSRHFGPVLRQDVFGVYRLLVSF